MAVNLLIAAFCSALAAFVDALPLLWNLCSNNSLCPTVIAIVASRPFGAGKFLASHGWIGLWDVLSGNRTSEAISIAVQRYSPHELNLSIPPVAILSALGLCCAAALTHGLGGRLKYRHLPWMFWQPFVGGARFVFMQAFAWILFSFSLLGFLLASVIAIFIGRAVAGHGLLASAGVTGLASQFVLVASLLTFESPAVGSHGSSSTGLSNRVDDGSSSLVLKKGRQQRQPQEKQDLPLPQLLPVVHDTATEADVNTRGGRTSDVAADTKGPTEATTQVGEGEVAAQSKTMFAGQEELVRPSHWSPRQVLLGFVATEDMMGFLLASLLRAVSAVLHPPSAPPPRLRALDGRPVVGLTRKELVWWLTVKMRGGLSLFFMYNMHYPLVFSLLATFALPRFYANLLWCFYVIVYGWMLTWDGKPRTSRKWASEWVQDRLVESLSIASVCHFGAQGMRIIKDFPQQLSRDTKYIFTYHPHGIMPTFLSWFAYSDAWSKLFPGVRPISLVASVIFRIPGFQQMALLGGMREVSRSSFQETLQSNGSVVLCPGGQSELAKHQPIRNRHVVLCARKTGFVRLAVEEKALLVPCFSINEEFLYDNLFYMPALQRWTYKKFGFPIPFLPVGVWNIVPVPKGKPVCLVVGEPFDPRERLQSDNPPSKEDIDGIRDEYYERVVGLFHKYKHTCGLEDVTISIDYS